MEMRNRISKTVMRNMKRFLPLLALICLLLPTASSAMVRPLPYATEVASFQSTSLQTQSDYVPIPIDSDSSFAGQKCRNDPVNVTDPLGLHEFTYKYGGGDEDFSASSFVPSLVPKRAPSRPMCFISSAPVRQYRDVEILRAPEAGTKYLRQADMLVPSHFIGTPMGEQMAQFESELIVGALAQPGLSIVGQTLWKGGRIGWLLAAEGRSIQTARQIITLSDELATAPIVSVDIAKSASTVAAKSTTTAIKPYYPPNQGFLGETSREFLYAGQRIDRYGGSSSSRFFSPAGAPVGARSLPPGTVSQRLRSFEVVKPFEVESGTVAPYFGEIGYGPQYRTPVTLDTLRNRGILREATP